MKVLWPVNPGPWVPVWVFVLVYASQYTCWAQNINTNTQGITSTNPGAWRVVVENDIPNGLQSTRSSTLQNLLTVGSYLSCGGIGTACNCAAGEQKAEYQVVVSVDLPCKKGPSPVVFLWHGTDNIAVYDSNSYSVYVDALTKAGFAVVQYDVVQSATILKVTDAVEMQFPAQILDWMKVMARNPVSNLYQKFDFSNVAVAGHSHGGSLAAYAYANDVLGPAYAMYLIDPVDCSCLWPCYASNCFLSGFDALLQKKNDTPIGMSAADIVGCCNPSSNPNSCYLAGNSCPANNYLNFLAASGSSQSWASLWSAGNSQFATVAAATPAHQVAADTFCGSNPSVSQNDLMGRVADQMVDWFKQELLKTDPAWEAKLAPTGECAVKPAVVADGYTGMAALPLTTATTTAAFWGAAGKVVSNTNAAVFSAIKQAPILIKTLTFNDVGPDVMSSSVGPARASVLNYTAPPIAGPQLAKQNLGLPEPLRVGPPRTVGTGATASGTAPTSSVVALPPAAAPALGPPDVTPAVITAVSVQGTAVPVNLATVSASTGRANQPQMTAAIPQQAGPTLTPAVPTVALPATVASPIVTLPAATISAQVSVAGGAKVAGPASPAVPSVAAVPKAPTQASPGALPLAVPVALLEANAAAAAAAAQKPADPATWAPMAQGPTAASFPQPAPPATSTPVAVTPMVPALVNFAPPKPKSPGDVPMALLQASSNAANVPFTGSLPHTPGGQLSFIDVTRPLPAAPAGTASRASASASLPGGTASPMPPTLSPAPLGPSSTQYPSTIGQAAVPTAPSGGTAAVPAAPSGSSATAAGSSGSVGPVPQIVGGAGTAPAVTGANAGTGSALPGGQDTHTAQVVAPLAQVLPATQTAAIPTSEAAHAGQAHTAGGAAGSQIFPAPQQLPVTGSTDGLPTRSSQAGQAAVPGGQATAAVATSSQGTGGASSPAMTSGQQPASSAGQSSAAHQQAVEVAGGLPPNLGRQDAVAVEAGTPSTQSVIPAPAVQSVNPAPAGQSVNPAPAAQSVQPAPAVQSVQPAPAVQGVNPAPAVQSMNPGLGAQRVQPAPAAQLVQQSPAVQSVESAPVSQRAQPAPAQTASRTLGAGNGGYIQNNPAANAALMNPAATGQQRGPSQGGVAGFVDWAQNAISGIAASTRNGINGVAAALPRGPEMPSLPGVQSVMPGLGTLIATTSASSSPRTAAAAADASKASPAFSSTLRSTSQREAVPGQARVGTASQASAAYATEGLPNTRPGAQWAAGESTASLSARPEIGSQGATRTPSSDIVPIMTFARVTPSSISAAPGASEGPAAFPWGPAPGPAFPDILDSSAAASPAPMAAVPAAVQEFNMAPREAPLGPVGAVPAPQAAVAPMVFDGVDMLAPHHFQGPDEVESLWLPRNRWKTSATDPPPAPLDPRAWNNLSAAALANRKRAAAGLKAANLRKQTAAGLADRVAATPPARAPSEPWSHLNKAASPSPGPDEDVLEPFAPSASAPGHGPKLVHLTHRAVSPSGPAALAMLTVQGDFAAAASLPAQSAPLQEEVPGSGVTINIFPVEDVNQLKKAAGVPVAQPAVRPKAPSAPAVVAPALPQTTVLPAKSAPAGPVVQGPAKPAAPLVAGVVTGSAGVAQANTAAQATGPPSQAAQVSATPSAPVHNSDGSMVLDPADDPWLQSADGGGTSATTTPAASKASGQTLVPQGAGVAYQSSSQSSITMNPAGSNLPLLTIKSTTPVAETGDPLLATFSRSLADTFNFEGNNPVAVQPLISIPRSGSSPGGGAVALPGQSTLPAAIPGLGKLPALPGATPAAAATGVGAAGSHSGLPQSRSAAKSGSPSIPAGVAVTAHASVSSAGQPGQQAVSVQGGVSAGQGAGANPSPVPAGQAITTSGGRAQASSAVGQGNGASQTKSASGQPGSAKQAGLTGQALPSSKASPSMGGGSGGVPGFINSLAGQAATGIPQFLSQGGLPARPDAAQAVTAVNLLKASLPIDPAAAASLLDRPPSNPIEALEDSPLMSSDEVDWLLSKDRN